MSDWGAVHSVGAAEAGLDQESGAQIDKEVYFDAPLRAAIARGEASPARLDDMVRRILRSAFAVGLIDPAPPGDALDLAADAAVAGRASERSLVLLKNADGLLPLAADAKRIAVIGGRADIGVLSGGGSSQVVPRGSIRAPHPPDASRSAPRAVYHPSSPLRAIQARAAKAEVLFDSGVDPAPAARLAASSDIAIVFARQWTTEGFDAKVGLDAGEDALIQAVTAANPKTVVVLETGGPVLTPWLAKAGAVLEAWYPGSGGGEAIARVLFGEADPAGRLPVTFPASLEQSPRPKPVGSAPEDEALARQAPSFDVDYREGSSVGYRWFAQTGAKPLFPFGFGLSYGRFCYGPLSLSGGLTVTASFTVTNCGARAAVETPQLYLEAAPKRRQERLLGWSKLDLKPGETRTVRLTVDPRLLANWDQAEHGWRLDAGAYRIFAGPNAGEIRHVASVRLPGRRLHP